MSEFLMVAPCLFGIEGLLADELRRMDAKDVTPDNGRVFFSGDDEILARANINCRLAERILIVLGSFEAKTFEELFVGVKNIPLEKYIGKNDAFPVKGWSINSALFSIPDCQSIVKKAAVERLKSRYNVNWFKEDGPLHQLQFSILKNKVTIMLDSTGFALHKRGYRKNGNEAPIRETLASAMCNQARIYNDTKLYDPFCGSGTLLIEAAMIAANIAPGLNNTFAAESFKFVDQSAFFDERTVAKSKINKNIEFHAYGSDVDPSCVKLTKENAEKAGVSDLISVETADFKDFEVPDGRFLLITNPPYGERLMDLNAAEGFIYEMGKKFVHERGKKYFIISPHEEFESIFGRKADKRRKLYNGTIKCQLYMYFR